MKKGFISLLSVVVLGFSQLSLAAGSSFPLMDFTPELEDKAALQRGAKTYVNYCLGCHGMKYKRFNRLAADLEIPEKLVLENFIFDDTKIGGHMEASAPAKLQKKWFGAAPPDLTLAARARGDKWLYTYLQAFYVDESRPYGYNNLLFKDVGMPNVLLSLQGDQACRPAIAIAANGGVKRDPLSGEFVEDDNKPCSRAVHVSDTGSKTPEEFAQIVSDLVSFMVYAAEPQRLHDRSFLGMNFNQREVIGVYSLLFLLVFGAFALLLNREYWKDIH